VLGWVFRLPDWACKSCRLAQCQGEEFERGILGRSHSVRFLCPVGAVFIVSLDGFKSVRVVVSTYSFGGLWSCTFNSRLELALLFVDGVDVTCGTHVGGLYEYGIVRIVR
jgi:hypothetical protein